MSNPTDQTLPAPQTAPMQFQYVATDAGAYVIAFPVPKAEVPAAEVVAAEARADLAASAEA